MASGPITSWQIDGEAMETVTDFIFLGSKITVDGDCSHEIKMLASWKKRHYFTDKGQSSQSLVFPVVMCGCASWTIKKAEHRSNPEIPVAPGEEHYVLDKSLDEVYFALQ